MECSTSTILDQRFSRTPLARALVLSLGMGFAGNAMSATYAVSSLADDGSVGTLRWAIEQANATPEDDVVDLSTMSGSITLELGPLYLNVGPDPTYGGGNLTIDGPGATVLTVAGGANHVGSVFYVSGYGAAQIDGLTIAGGDGGTGGGIANWGADLTVQNSVITGNDAVWGGGVFSTSYAGYSGYSGYAGYAGTGSVTLQRCIVTENAAGSLYNGGGGGVFVDGMPLIIADSVIARNTAYFTDGGGVVVARAFGDITATISASEITGNTANGDGGGVFVTSRLFGDAGQATLEVTDSTISGNTAGGNGGGLSATAPFYTPYYTPYYIGLRTSRSERTCDVNITGDGRSQWLNKACGGGIEASKDLVRAPVAGGTTTVIVTNSTISGNTAGGWGGGAHAFAQYGGTTSLEISNSTVSGNDARGGGGVGVWGHYGAGTAGATISNSTITGNAAYYKSGGGLYIWYGSATADHSIIAGNTASSYGPDVFNYYGSLSLAYTLVGDSSSPGDGFTEGAGNVLDSEPLLGPLQDNGGPTLTHLPAADSPVVDAGDPAATGLPATDQRGTGYPRVENGVVDLGAVETPPPPTIGLVTPGNGSLTVSFTPNDAGTNEYTATCTPDGGGTPVSNTGSGSPITVSGLANEVNYSCTVAVAGYTGVSDSASAAGTPRAPAEPQPIPTLGLLGQWLISLLLGGLGFAGLRRRREE